MRRINIAAPSYIIMNLSKSFMVAIAVLSSLVGLTACDVHEFPDVNKDVPTGPSVDFRLDLKFDTEMPIYQEITHPSRNDVYIVRYIVRGYWVNANGNIQTDVAPQCEKIITSEELNNLDRSIDVSLPEGNYRFFVWTDYNTTSTPNNLFYNTDNFADIFVKTKPYTGSTDYRDAFRGALDVEVKANGSAEIEMKRPMGKYTLVSDDVDKFIEKVRDSLIQHAIEEGRDPSEVVSRDINPEEYQVRVGYTGFMPSAFNNYTNKAIDSSTGVTFTSHITLLGNNEAEIAFDYVLINGEETKVGIMVEIYEKDAVIGKDEPISRSSSIEVPLRRSHLTIIKGAFLTSQAQGGIGIDPGFDGEYNIEIR